jgi:hypothetical protein
MSQNYTSQDGTLHTPPLGINLAQSLIKQKRKFKCIVDASSQVAELGLYRSHWTFTWSTM